MTHIPIHTQQEFILYANFFMCIIMGFPGSPTAMTVIPSLLTTGYCGAFSSSSTYIYEIFIHTVLKVHLFSNYGATVSEFL